MLITHNQTPIPTDLKIFIDNNNSNENDPSKIIEISRISSNDPVPAIKYLGVFFDPQLNFKYHIAYLSKKLSNALFSLRQVKNVLPPFALKTLYYSLFHCHLVYAIEIWSCTPQSLIKPLVTKQKAAIRIISSQPYNAHTEPLFKSLAILPLNLLIEVSNLKLFHSFIYNTLPSEFTGTWNSVIEQRALTGDNQLLYNLRNNNDMFVPPARTQFVARFPFYNLPKIWNSLPQNLRDIPSKSLFAIKLKKFYLDKLKDKPTCNRLLCPACLRIPT